MEAYRQKIKKTMLWRIALFISAIAVVRVAFFIPYYGTFVEFVDYSPVESTQIANLAKFYSFVGGFTTGLLAVFVVLFVVQLIQYVRALKNPDQLKKLYIKEHDERVAFIRNRIGGTAYPFIMVALIVASYVSACIGLISVTLTLIGVLLLMSIVMFGLKMYYHRAV